MPQPPRRPCLGAPRLGSSSPSVGSPSSSRSSTPRGWPPPARAGPSPAGGHLRPAPATSGDDRCPGQWRELVLSAIRPQPRPTRHRAARAGGDPLLRLATPSLLQLPPGLRAMNLGASVGHRKGKKEKWIKPLTNGSYVLALDNWNGLLENCYSICLDKPSLLIRFVLILFY